MSLIPNSPSPFVRGLVSYSGRGNHVNSARHAQDYPVAQHHAGKTSPLLHMGTGLAGAAKFAAQKKGEKKTPATLKSMTGAVGLTQEQCNLSEQVH